jgi:hypothetical protein
VSKISIAPISILFPISCSLIKAINLPGFKLSFLPIFIKKESYYQQLL